MLNSGRRGSRSSDGYGILSVNEKFNQTNYPIPIISSWAVTDGSYNPTGATALSTAGGETVVIYGSGFQSGVTVNVNGSNIGVVTLLDQGRITFTSPALASATYTIYVSNTNGATAIYVPGLIYSGVPTWSSPTAGSIGTSYETKSVSTLTSNTFIATGDAPLTYSIVSGNLPSGVTLNSNGTLSGTLPVTSSATTYSFTIRAYDAQLQTSDRSFSLTINPDVVTWITPTQNGSLTVYETQAFSTPLSATSAAGYGVMYTANTLPTGITLTGSTGVLSGYANTVGNTYALLTATANTTNRSATSNVRFTVNQDVVTWGSPANNTNYAVNQGVAISPVTLSANSAAGYGVQYTANTLPTGLSLSGNTITGTPTGSGTTYTQLTATANTTNRLAYQFISFTVSIASDLYFANTTLLLSANSSYQTSSFITDASNNNSQLTLFGDTKAQSFNPYQHGYYSCYFNGSGDQLTASGSGPADFGTGNFTIEMWIYVPANTGAYQAFYNSRNSGSGLFFGLSNGSLILIYYVGGVRIQDSVAITLNTWIHVALVRNSGTTTLYKNGVAVGTPYTDTNNFTSTIAEIGKDTSYSYDFKGYMSNVRILKGTALYTTNFTPSTTPLTAVANTQLLVCNANRFIDASNSNFAITRNGNTAITQVHPFASANILTAAANTWYGSAGITYTSTPITTYGSGYFDGTGDYLTCNTSAPGTGDFTIETWVYFTAWAGVNGNSDFGCFQVFGNSASAPSNSGPALLIIGSSKYWSLVYGGTYTSSTTAAKLNQWYNITIVRTGGNTNLYVNGTQIISVADGSTYSGTNTYIGGYYTVGSYLMTGYISDFKVTNSALYTSNFVPNFVSPSTVSANTKLLTLQTNFSHNNSVFDDKSSFNNLIINGRSATTSTFSPYGNNWSVYFNGTSDYFTVPLTTAFQGSFTIEFWLYVVAMPSVLAYLFQINAGNNLTIYLSPAGNISYSGTSGGSRITSNATVATGVWTHIAISRVGVYGSSGLVKMFINGTQQTTTYNDGGGDNWAAGTAYIGTDANQNYFLKSYISNFRIVNGSGLYTASFTPSTTPLTAVTGTNLLTCQSNRLIDKSVNNFTITPIGPPSIQKFSPFSSNAYSTSTFGGSFYFSGNPGGVGGVGDYLILPTTSLLSLSSSSDFTISTWMYITGTTGRMYIYDGGLVGNTTNLTIYTNNSTSTISFRMGGFGNDTPTITPWPLYSWAHIAVVRKSGTVDIYVNGTSVLSIASTATALGTIGNYIGYIVGSSIAQTSSGYFSDWQFVPRALYSSSFVPPTSPISSVSYISASTDIANTAYPTIFLNGVNGGIKDQTRTTTLTSFGDVKVVNKFGPYQANTNISYYFDGTGDYLYQNAPAGNIPIQFNTGDYTVETWIYPNNLTPVNGIFQIGNLKANTTASTGAMTVYGGASGTTLLITGGVLTQNVWSHVAVTRQSGVGTTLWINGTQSGSVVVDSATYANSIVFIGSVNNAASPFTGYLSDFRVTTGTARYTSNNTTYLNSNSPYLNK